MARRSKMTSPDDMSNHPANAMFEAVLGPPLSKQEPIMSNFKFVPGPPKKCEAASLKQIEALANQKAAAITGAKSVGGGTIKVFTAPHVEFNYYIKDSAGLRKVLARFGIDP